MAMRKYKMIERASYTVKLLVPGLEAVGERYRSMLSGLLQKPTREHRLHLGLKYLGHEAEFDDGYMLQFVPELRKCAAAYLPLEGAIQGIEGFWNSPQLPSKPIIFLRVLPNDKLQRFHNEIRLALENRVTTFSLAEGKYYTPHITIGTGKQEDEAKLKSRVNSTQNDNPIYFTAERFVMRLKGGRTRNIFP